MTVEKFFEIFAGVREAKTTDKTDIIRVEFEATHDSFKFVVFDFYREAEINDPKYRESRGHESNVYGNWLGSSVIRANIVKDLVHIIDYDICATLDEDLFR